MNFKTNDEQKVALTGCW